MCQATAKKFFQPLSDVVVLFPVIVAVFLFPAASLAVAVIMFSPLYKLILAIDQVVVPAAVPDPPLLFVQLTLVTPALSDAVPLKLIVLWVVE